MVTRLPSLVTALLVAAAHVARVSAQLPRAQLPRAQLPRDQLPRTQLPRVAHVDTDAQLRSRDPFVLRSGELYRDLLTIHTSQLAAVFARQFEVELQTNLHVVFAMAFSWLKAPTSTFTLKKLLRIFAIKTNPPVP